MMMMKRTGAMDVRYKDASQLSRTIFTLRLRIDRMCVAPWCLFRLCFCFFCPCFSCSLDCGLFPPFWCGEQAVLPSLFSHHFLCYEIHRIIFWRYGSSSTSPFLLFSFFVIDAAVVVALTIVVAAISLLFLYFYSMLMLVALKIKPTKWFGSQFQQRIHRIYMHTTLQSQSSIQWIK